MVRAAANNRQHVVRSRQVAESRLLAARNNREASRAIKARARNSRVVDSKATRGQGHKVVAGSSKAIDRPANHRAISRNNQKIQIRKGSQDRRALRADSHGLHARNNRTGHLNHRQTVPHQRAMLRKVASPDRIAHKASSNEETGQTDRSSHGESGPQVRTTNPAKRVVTPARQVRNDVLYFVINP